MWPQGFLRELRVAEDAQQNERYLRDKVERLTRANAELRRENEDLSKRVARLESELSTLSRLYIYG